MQLYIDYMADSKFTSVQLKGYFTYHDLFDHHR